MKITQILSILFGSCLVLLACSDQGNTVRDLAVTPVPTVTPVSMLSVTKVPSELSRPVPTRTMSTPVQVEVYGGSLRLATKHGVRHEDVHQEAAPSLAIWGPGLAYSRLLRFKSGEGLQFPNMVVECEICFAWEMEDDLNFVFYLREEATWQGLEPVNGRKLTPEDIAYSYTRQAQVEFPNSSLLKGIASTNVTREGEIRFSLVIPDADFLLSLADGRSKIVAEEVVEIRGDLLKGPTIGSGPWILETTDLSDIHIFVKNLDYFEQNKPPVDRLVIQVISDDITRDAAFGVGAIDVHNLSQQASIHLMQNSSDFEYLVMPNSGSRVELSLNTSKFPFTDIRVRQAVFQAMHPWKAIDDMWDGIASVGLGISVVDPGWLLTHDEIAKKFGHPEHARNLLTNASDQVPIPVTIKVGDFGEHYISHANRISKELKAVGFEPVVEIVSQLDFADTVWFGGDYQIFFGPMPPLTMPNEYILNVLHSKGQWNTNLYQNEELDALIEAQSKEYDPIVRADLARRIQLHVLDGAYRFTTVSQSTVWAWWPHVRNFYPNFAGLEYAHWSKIWIED